MLAPRAFTKRHPVLAYYILVFSIPWASILLLSLSLIGLIVTALFYRNLKGAEGGIAVLNTASASS